MRFKTFERVIAWAKFKFFTDDIKIEIKKSSFQEDLRNCLMKISEFTRRVSWVESFKKDENDGSYELNSGRHRSIFYVKTNPEWPLKEKVFSFEEKKMQGFRMGPIFEVDITASSYHFILKLKRIRFKDTSYEIIFSRNMGRDSFEWTVYSSEMENFDIHRCEDPEVIDFCLKTTKHLADYMSSGSFKKC